MRSCPHCLSPYAQPVEFCGIDGTRLVERKHDPLIGSDVDRYRILAHIGDGGMARVYRVKHHVLDRELAMKVLFGEYAANKTLAQRFRREAQTISKIIHDNIVGISDFGRTPAGLTFLAMELVRGSTLRRVVKSDGPMLPSRAASIARQIASGLMAAHDLGFVHRDLKPGNVMLVNSGGSEVVKILDFGLARMADSDGDELYLTRTGQFLGTPIYMAPEQIIGADVDHLADIYALGVVLFEMLEGHPPFKAKKLAEIRHKHLVEPPPTVRASGGLEDLVAALLKKTAAERPPNAKAVIEMIDRLELGPAVATELATVVGVDPSAEDRHEKTVRTPMPDGITKRVSLVDRPLEVASVSAGEAIVKMHDDGPTRPSIARPVFDAPTPLFDDDDGFSPVETASSRIGEEPTRSVVVDPSVVEPRLDSSVASLDASAPGVLALSGIRPSSSRVPIVVAILSAVAAVAVGFWVQHKPSTSALAPIAPASAPPVVEAASGTDAPTKAAVGAEPPPPPVEPPPVAPPPVAPPPVEPPPPPTAAPERKRRAIAPPPPTAVPERKRRPPSTAKKTNRTKQRRQLDAEIALAIKNRGLIRADVENDAHSAQAWRRWRAARQTPDSTELTEAAETLLEKVASLPFTRSVVDRRLDLVSSLLAKAAKTVPPETLRPLEDRYLELVSNVGSAMSSSQGQRLAAAATALAADIRRVDR